MDPRLTNVSSEIKRIEAALSDAEWEGDPRSEYLARELEYYKHQASKGVTYEPNF